MRQHGRGNRPRENAAGYHRECRSWRQTERGGARRVRGADGRAEQESPRVVVLGRVPVVPIRSVASSRPQGGGADDDRQRTACVDPEEGAGPRRAAPRRSVSLGRLFGCAGLRARPRTSHGGFARAKAARLSLVAPHRTAPPRRVAAPHVAGLRSPVARLRAHPRYTARPFPSKKPATATRLPAM